MSGRPQYAGKRRDENEPGIVNALELIGAKVVRAHQPCDLIVGYRGKTFLLEVENPDGDRHWNKKHAERAEDWPGGEISIVTDIASAVCAIGAQIKGEE